ncbi:MAG: hypothetical protein LBP22_17130 [Deltaproteobacteria bacterium]|jgi:uncharacterized Zn finger protein|nr:hypothetical protein [Deltaproteobacteria bacterium]
MTSLIDKKSSPKPAVLDNPPLKLWLELKPKEELIDLLLEMNQRFPQAAEYLGGTKKSDKIDPDELISGLRAEADSVMVDPERDYRGRMTPPNYYDVMAEIEKLVPLGLDEKLMEVVVDLIEHVEEMSQEYHWVDEYGEIAGEFYSLAVKILKASSLDEADKIIWAIDLIRASSYDMSSQLDRYLKENRPPEVYSQVAERLEHSDKLNEDSSDHYGNSWVAWALEKSERKDLAISRYEKDLESTLSYQPLVDLLIAEGRLTEAENYIEQGVQKTRHAKPYLTSRLLEQRARIFEVRRQWPELFDHYLCRFLESPSLSTYNPVRETAVKMDIWPKVRPALFDFLETGLLPWLMKGWDIPQPDQLEQTELLESVRKANWLSRFPLVAYRLEVALLEKEMPDIIKWHEKLHENRSASLYGADSFDLQVAQAVRDYAPEKSLVIWKRMAESKILVGKKYSYSKAVACLRNLRELMSKLGRKAEFDKYLAELRVIHKRRRLFLVELLQL